MASLIAQGGHYDWQIVNGANAYGKENIVSGTLTDGIYENVSIGGTIARQLNLRLWNVTIDTSSPIVLSVSAVSAGGSVAISDKGTYYIDTVSTSPYSEYTEITAFDAMLKSEVVFMKEGTWTTTTAQALVAEIATLIGITVATSTNSYFASDSKDIDQAPNIGQNGTTARQILSTIATLYAGSFIINDYNELEFIPYSARLFTRQNVTSRQYSGITTAIVGDEVIEFDKSDAMTINRVELQANGGEIYRSPSGLSDDDFDALGGYLVSINLPFMASQEAADSIYSLVHADLIPARSAYTARGAYCSPALALGTLLTIKNTTVFLANRTININPLATCDLEIKSQEEMQSFYPYIDPVTREARQKIEENYAAITILPSQIMSEVYTKGETDERISSQVTQTADALTISFDEKLGTAVGEANAYTQEQTEGLRTYFTFGSDGLTIGKSDSPFKTEISNTELAFTGESGEKAAWINANQLNIQEAVIPTDGDIQLKGSSGKWVQQVRNDHFQIRWVGN